MVLDVRYIFTPYNNIAPGAILLMFDMAFGNCEYPLSIVEC